MASSGTIRVLSEAIGDVNYSAFVIAFVTLAVGVLWPRALSRIVPGTLVALIVGTLLSVLWLAEVPVIGIIPSGLPEIVLVPPTADFLLRAIEPALILALLGSVDSLLTSLIADSLTGTRHKADQELVGQGIGNMVAGLIGGLPGAGATMGTVTNIRAGGYHPFVRRGPCGHTPGAAHGPGAGSSSRSRTPCSRAFS